ncbi:alpha/beta hydrolase [Microlunatus elymi]|uniref:alpha/beta hydrolase n=1 Tax=Microlunatus elymi TaxID=2596828 RepID=UPI001D184AB3|nr:alpha/beta hydrolase [Microlunatus elymi]
MFVNPGGPGGSAADLAAAADGLFPTSVLAHYDIVGIDPRGVGYSDLVQCFASEKTQRPVLAKLNVAFPVGTKQTKTYEQGAAAAGKACSHHGAPLTGAVSTAEDARDMDVIRRAVGDKELTYLGFSYGTYLGQVYANLFPDRVRSMVLDGVLDPIAWAGTAKTKSTPQTIRVPSGQASLRAFNELLDRCDRAKKCTFKTASQTSRQRFAKLAQRLHQHNIQTPDTYNYYVYSYADAIAEITSDLYAPDGGQYVVEFLQALEKGKNSTLPPGPIDDTDLARKTAAQHKPAALRETVNGLRNTEQTSYGFPYDNSFEAFTAPLCTDSLNPAKVTDWPKAVNKINSSAKYFGGYWAGSSAPCASSTWTIKDEDAYRGPFDKRTSGPVLVVGDFWDPATNYRSAEKVSKLLPNSRLLLSDSWGHTAYGTSACVTDAVTTALVQAKMPAKGTRCVGDDQPFGVSTPTPRSRTTAVSGVDPAKVSEILRSHPGRY